MSGTAEEQGARCKVFNVDEQMTSCPRTRGVYSQVRSGRTVIEQSDEEFHSGGRWASPPRRTVFRVKGNFSHGR